MIYWLTVNYCRPHRRTVDGGLGWHCGTRLSLLDLIIKAGSAAMTSSGHVPSSSAAGGVEPGIPAGDRAASGRIVIMQHRVNKAIGRGSPA